MDLVVLIFSILAFCGTASTHTALILWLVYYVLIFIAHLIKD